MAKKDAASKGAGSKDKTKAKKTKAATGKSKLTDDDVLGFLGPPKPAEKAKPQQQATEGSEESARSLLSEMRTPLKSCPKCGREIKKSIHVCPHCNTYIAGEKEAWKEE